MLSGQFDANLPDGRWMSRREISEDSDQIASRIAQKLRDAKFSCQIATFEPADTAVLWRDRIVVILAFTLLTTLAWSYLLWLSADMSMGGIDMGDFRMIPSGMGFMVPAHTPWDAMEFGFVFVMWTVMMVGMMTPSAAPMILMYARVGRHTAAQGTPFAATIWFAAGYFLVWLAFALLATLVQWALERTALLDSWMASMSNVLGGLVFVAAGTYQWTRLKDVCLAQCQTPFAFLMRHGGFRSDAPGSLMLGLRHGSYCVGCCWVVCGRHNERALDCRTRATRTLGESHSVRPPDCFSCRNGPHRCRRVVILDGNALRARLGNQRLTNEIVARAQAGMSAFGRFCCRSLLKAGWLSDSVAVM